MMAGGAGWGDPLQRDPELVRRDVRAGKLSREYTERGVRFFARTGDLRGLNSLGAVVMASVSAWPTGPLGAEVLGTEGVSEKPLSSSRTIQACLRRAPFLESVRAP